MLLLPPPPCALRLHTHPTTGTTTLQSRTFHILKTDIRHFQVGKDGQGDPKWRAFGGAAKRAALPVLRILMLRWPREWLRDERKLMHFLQENPPGRYVPNATVEACIVDNTAFDVPRRGQRYMVGAIAGKGAFATVAWGKDALMGTRVAIKRMLDAAPDSIGGSRLMRELGLLRRCRGHVNIVSPVDLLVEMRPSKMAGGGSREVVDVYMVTELSLTDLGSMFDSHFCLSAEQVKCLLYQVTSTVINPPLPSLSPCLAILH
jgi:hypothetical protein